MSLAWELASQAAPIERSRPDVARAPLAAVGRATSLSPAGVLMLQRSSGNAAVSALLRQSDGEDGVQAVPEGEEEEEVSLGTITIPAPEPVEVEVFAPGPTLEGKTTATYTATDAVLSPDPPKASRAKGCAKCGDANCIRAQGTVSSTFASNPTVTLPDLDAHGFTDCQRTNAEKFVKNVLSPHEQLHVNAFTTNFDGAWKKAFDLKVCDTDEAAAEIKALYDAEYDARKAKADAASDALDAGGKNVFSWDMDEGCATP